MAALNNIFWYKILQNSPSFKVRKFVDIGPIKPVVTYLTSISISYNLRTDLTKNPRTIVYNIEKCLKSPMN